MTLITQDMYKREARRREIHDMNTLSKYVCDFEYGDEIVIAQPGKNRPSSMEDALKMGSKWYKRMAIMGKPKIHQYIGWYFVDSLYKGKNTGYVCLIRNDELEIDLVIAVTGILATGRKVIILEFFKDEDFYI